MQKEEILKNGLLLIDLSDEEVEDATSINKENEDKMLVVTEKDIQKFKGKWMMYWMCPYSTLLE